MIGDHFRHWHPDKKSNSRFKIYSRILLIFGLTIGLAALFYMIFNLETADSVINIWLPFMAASVGMIFMSQLIKLIFR